jgi:hypothetical protein
MIKHEITISNFNPNLYTLNRDLKKHREGDLPAQRVWNQDRLLGEVTYYLNGNEHREEDISSFRWTWGMSYIRAVCSLNGNFHCAWDFA